MRFAGVRRELRPALFDTVNEARRFAAEHELPGSLLEHLNAFRKARNYGLTILPAMPLTGLIVDVGANIGGFTDAVLSAEPRSRVIAIEPAPGPSEALRSRYGNDARVQLETCAIAETQGNAMFNVAAESEFSSLRSPDEKLSQIYGHGVDIVDAVPVPTTTLDHIIDGPVTLLKVDAQGGEREVFSGATETLAVTRAILVEALFVPHYQGEAAFPELHALLTDEGFTLAGVGDVAKTSRHALWCDLCYINRDV